MYIHFPVLMYYVINYSKNKVAGMNIDITCSCQTTILYTGIYIVTVEI